MRYVDLAFAQCVGEQLYNIQKRFQGQMDRELSPESELDDRARTSLLFAPFPQPHFSVDCANLPGCIDG